MRISPRGWAALLIGILLVSVFVWGFTETSAPPGRTGEAAVGAPAPGPVLAAARRAEEKGEPGPARAAECPVAGNKRSKIYHVPGGRYYGRMLESKNRVCFGSEEKAKEEGYRRSKR